MNSVANIQHVLLDIEGTTCPVSFVSEVLFPYARKQLLPYLNEHESEVPIKLLLKEIHAAWQKETDQEAIALATRQVDLGPLSGSHRQPDARTQREPIDPATWSDVARTSNETRTSDQEAFSIEETCLYLNWLIKKDRKLTAMKDLQGLIWEEGYQKGELIAPLFPDVADALRRWHANGTQLSVYSSGSVQAQKLLYSHTSAGDLSHLFSGWFDTRIGAKNRSSSYAAIANILQLKPEQILFISDAVAELVAARSIQMAVMFSRRPGNPPQDAEGFPSLENFSGLDP